MNAPATQSPKIDRAYAIQCLTHILERTTKLLVTAANGGKWDMTLVLTDIRALPIIATDFVEACGMQPHAPEPTAPWARQAVRQRRILGDLHAAVSDLLVKCAHESVAPETGDAFGATHEIHRVHDIAVAFVASIDR